MSEIEVCETDTVSATHKNRTRDNLAYVYMSARTCRVIVQGKDRYVYWHLYWYEKILISSVQDSVALATEPGSAPSPSNRTEQPRIQRSPHPHASNNRRAPRTLLNAANDLLKYTDLLT